MSTTTGNTDTIVARLRLLAEMARCRTCGTPAAACATMLRTDPSDYVGCCYGHDHSIDATALRALEREIASGAVRTPGELGRPAGPRRVATLWLLHQDTWWYPKAEPALRIREMADTHRYNTLKMLERAAPKLALAEVWSTIGSPLQPSGDMACDAFEREMDWIERNPLAWLRSTPLWRALNAGLPSGEGGTRTRKRRRRLAQRARHWSTCPRRLALDVTLAGPCTCGVG